MMEMVAEVQDASSKGLTLKQAKRSIGLSKHACNFSNFQQASATAIERAWAEVAGKTKD